MGLTHINKNLQASKDAWRYGLTTNYRYIMLDSRELGRDDLDIRNFFHVPFALGRIVLGVHKAEPVLIILSRMVGLVVEARVTGLFTILDVAQVGFYGPDDKMRHMNLGI